MLIVKYFGVLVVKFSIGGGCDGGDGGGGLCGRGVRNPIAVKYPFKNCIQHNKLKTTTTKNIESLILWGLSLPGARGK